MVEPGRVVVLNGTSSAGKTTIATMFQQHRADQGECWLRTGIDDYIAALPDQWIGVPGYDNGPWSADGFRLVEIDDHVEVRGGEVWRRLMTAYRRTVAGWAHAGFDVIVDEVVLDDDAMTDWREALVGLTTMWVAVRCDLEVALARERNRGDRVVGLVRGQLHVHDLVAADLELDTTSTAPQGLVDRLIHAVAAMR